MKASTTHLPTNPAGTPILSCDLDDKCVHVDCESLLPELSASLANSPEVPDYVAHYCGLGYLETHREKGSKH